MANGSGTGRISEEKAALVLDRAARIDAGHGKWLDVSELREAAEAPRPILARAR